MDRHATLGGSRRLDELLVIRALAVLGGLADEGGSPGRPPLIDNHWECLDENCLRREWSSRGSLPG